MKRWGNLLFALALLVTGAMPAFAQGGGASSTGSINGEVADASGAVLPGVTVTATSPALIGQQSIVTNAEGKYRFPSVAPGEYKLAYELPGFSTVVREGIRVGLGFTATVNVKLQVATLQETVTVSGESPTIDTTATRVQTNYTQEQLASIPNARDMWSLLATAPSVTLGNKFDVGGSSAGTQSTYYAYGYSGQNRPLIEGINTTEGTSAAGFYLDYGSFEEVFVGAAGNSAEMPNPGVITQFVSKGGGNRFTPSVYFDYENDKLQSHNMTTEQAKPYTGIPMDGNRLYRYKNLNLGLGGPLLRDKVWFFGALLYQQNQVLQPPGGIISDGTVFKTQLDNYTGKGTYQMNANNKFVGYYQYGKKQQPNRVDAQTVGTPIHTTADSTVLQASPSWVYKGEYNRTMGQNGFLEFRAGQFGYDFGLDSNTEATRYEDLVTSVVTGGGRHWELDRRRNQYTGSYSLFKDSLLGGSHNFKFGGEYLKETGNTMWPQGYANNVIHVLSNGQPAQVRLWLAPSASLNQLNTTSLFVTDTYALGRVTLNLGVRVDKYDVKLPAQEHQAGRFFTTATQYAARDIISFKNVVPRLGIVYDLSGTGKTVLKQNIGKFYFNPGVNLADASNPNSANQWAQYNWNDTNGDKVFQPGETVGNPISAQGGTVGTSIDANLSNSYTWESDTFVEREVVKDLGMRVGFVWKKDFNGYQQFNTARPVSAYNVANNANRDPVTGNTIAAFDLDTTTRGTTNVVMNLPGYEGTYKTLEVSANKRYSKRYSVVASYSYVWTNEWNNAYGGNRFATAVSNNSLFGPYQTNPNDRTDNGFTTWNAKLHGTIDAGWGLKVTPVVKMQSGTPYGRIVNARLNYSTAQPILVEPIGTHRLDSVFLMDFRIEKQLLLNKASKLGLFFDLFNVTNTNVETATNWVSGSNTLVGGVLTATTSASYGRPTTVLPPRIAKFGVKFDW